MTIVKPTLGSLLRIWFAISARALILALGGAVASSVIIGIVVSMTGGGADEISLLARVVSPLIAAPVGLYSIYTQIGRKCGNVRLVLVSAD